MQNCTISSSKKILRVGQITDLKHYFPNTYSTLKLTAKVSD